MDDNLNYVIAKIVFGLTQEAIDSLRWPIPNFSGTRNDAMRVVCQLHGKGKVAEIFDKKLAVTTEKYANMSEKMMALTPDVICTAAIEAFREYENKEDL